MQDEADNGGVLGAELSNAEPGSDIHELGARAALERLFTTGRQRVFFSRQLAVLHERQFFHWITGRVASEMIAEGLIHDEVRELPGGLSIHLMWHPSYRYHQRAAKRVVNLVQEYAHPDVAAAIGPHAELMAIEGFARRRFEIIDRHAKSFDGKTWTPTNHNLDFICRRDGVTYGVEVKNTLAYIEQPEFQAKLELCKYLGLRPVFVVRMLPKSWTWEVRQQGGFGLILRHQLYPLNLRELARRVRDELGLPVDAPRALYDGTMNRFENWHEANR